MKKLLFALLISASSLYLFSLPAQSAVKTGQPCKKINLTSIVSGFKYTCIKSGSKLIWSKGVKVILKTPSATPMSTPNVSQWRIGQYMEGWHWDAGKHKWANTSVTPKCTLPAFALKDFVDLSEVQYLIPPGLYRSNDYKPHGALRWSTIPEPYKSGIVVRLPFDATIINVFSNADEGAFQFGINAVSDCGIMIRIGHLYEPGPDLKKLLEFVDGWQKTTKGEIYVNAKMKKGTVIALNVGQPFGTAQGTGAGFDFGLLDLRALNVNKPVSFSGDQTLYYPGYSVCWLETPWISQSDVDLLKSIRVLGGVRTSDYCKKTN